MNHRFTRNTPHFDKSSCKFSLMKLLKGFIMYQSTIAKSVQIKGIGLHSGEEVSLKLSPAQADSGIVFYLQKGKSVVLVSPTPETVATTELATTLEVDNASVSTVEHLLAAINAMQIDNIQIHVEGKEIPILDGSALEFVHAFKRAGRKVLQQERVVAKITKPFSFIDGNKSIVARPFEGLYIDYTIDFPHHSIGKQRLCIEITPESFKEVAFARTFGFMKEIEFLHSKNLALGGSLANAIVLDEEGVVNPNGLRSDDEFVRHKILDFIGDIAMLGFPLQGAFEVKCSGHKHNNMFLRSLLTSQAFEIQRMGQVSKKSEREFAHALQVPVYNVL